MFCQILAHFAFNFANIVYDANYELLQSTHTDKCETEGGRKTPVEVRTSNNAANKLYSIIHCRIMRTVCLQRAKAEKSRASNKPRTVSIISDHACQLQQQVSEYRHRSPSVELNETRSCAIRSLITAGLDHQPRSEIDFSTVSTD